MRTKTSFVAAIGLRLCVPLFAAGLCAGAMGASDAETRTPAAPVTIKDLADPEKEEPSDSPDPLAPEFSKAADVVELPPVAKPIEKKIEKPMPAPTAKSAEAPVELHVDASLDEDILKTVAGPSRSRNAPATANRDRDGPATVGPKPLKNVEPDPVADARLTLPSKPITEPGYASVLTGTLQANTELNADTLPHLIRGVLIVPAKITLKINAGATIHLRADANATKPLQAGTPDPTKSAAVWVYGTLIVAGENGRPVEFAGQDKDNANLLLYGAELSKLDGARFKAADVAQNGGVCQWTNCEFNDSKYYALASGAGLFTHCTFEKCGGIFAAYDEGPWALLVRRCLFENCRDGLLLNRDPGQACLLVEKNNFIGTRGANLRAMPRASALNSKNAEELLIGENWYGTTVEEEIDRRIVDRRTDATIKAHLNTRPPSEKPFANAGAGALQTSIANTLTDQQAATAKMLTALAAKQKALADKNKMMVEKTSLGKEVVKKDIKN